MSSLTHAPLSAFGALRLRPGPILLMGVIVILSLYLFYTYREMQRIDTNMTTLLRQGTLLLTRVQDLENEVAAAKARTASACAPPGCMQIDASDIFSSMFQGRYPHSMQVVEEEDDAETTEDDDEDEDEDEDDDEEIEDAEDPPADIKAELLADVDKIAAAATSTAADAAAAAAAAVDADGKNADDDLYTEPALKVTTVRELRSILSAYGADTKGSKEVLITRILALKLAVLP
jgi:hypothetical protein